MRCQSARSASEWPRDGPGLRRDRGRGLLLRAGELRLEAVGEALHELCRDGGDEAAARLRERRPTASRSVLIETRVPPLVLRQSVDSIRARPSQRPRVSRALAASDRAHRVAVGLLAVHVRCASVSDIGPSFTSMRAFHVDSSIVSVSSAPGMHGITRGTSISRSHASSGRAGNVE